MNTSGDNSSPNEFARFADLLPEPMLLVAADGAVVAANRRATELFGFSAAGLIGRSLADFAQEPWQTVSSLLRTWSRSKNLLPGSLTFTGRGKKARRFRCEGAVFQPRTDSSPAVVFLRLSGQAAAVSRFISLNQRVDALTTEVSRRRRVEKALEEQREWLRVTLESIGDAVIAADRVGRVTFFNPVAAALTGFDAEETIGQPLESVFHIVNETTRKKVENPVAKVLERGVIVGLANHTVLIHKDGSEVPIDDSAAPIRGDDGNIFGVVMVFHDVTERRKLERAIRERTENLLDANRRKDDFLAMLAHELRNPLAPLLSGSQILLTIDSEDARVTQIGDMIVRQTQHLSRLIDDLLDVSRITRGKIELRRVPVSLVTALERSVEMVEPLMQTNRHELRTFLPPDTIWIGADAIRLAQIFANLLENAVKFTEPGGRITLRCESVDGAAIVRVQDNGIGIEKSMLPTIFELFAQEDKSLERTQGGLGLGLTVVKSLVAMHDGSIEASSAGPGHGSEFTVRLPTLAAGSGAESAESTVPAAAATSAPVVRRVQIVDDNEDAAAALAVLIRSLGHEVRIAYSGPDALAMSRSFLPDVVLLDIGLPGMDGYEVARKLRERAPPQPLLVAITGYGREEDRRRSRQSGFDEHLVKPVAFDAIKRLLIGDR